MNVNLEKARIEDVSDIATLINVAYRGDAGWTKETDFISGYRVSEKTINSLLQDSTIHFLVAYNLGDLLCCLCIEHSVNTANIGLFAVNPSLQQLGIGKSVLEQAEHYAVTVLKVKRIAMYVVSQRKELVDFYLRRGYFRQGLEMPYPKNLNSGTPKLANLTMLSLEKQI